MTAQPYRTRGENRQNRPFDELWRHPEIQRVNSIGLGHNLDEWREVQRRCARPQNMNERIRRDRGLGGLVKRLAGVL